MVRRPDLVLAAIPLLALGGLLADHYAHHLSAFVGAPIGRLPLTTLGVLAALVVVGYAVVRLPRT